MTPYHGTESRLAIISMVREWLMSLPNPKGSLAAAALAAVGASLCCVAPLLLLVLGVGGAWVSKLTVLEPLRPFLIVVTLLFLGLAFERLYLRQNTCGPDMLCSDPLVLRRLRLIFWIVFVGSIGLLSVPLLAPILIGGS